VWTRLLLPTKPYISDTHYRAQESLAHEGDNQVVGENAGWSSSPRAQGTLLLMLGVLQWMGRHGGCYDHQQSSIGETTMDLTTALDIFSASIFKFLHAL